MISLVPENPLRAFLNKKNIAESYIGVKTVWGNSDLIFSSMKKVATKHGFVFDLPASSAEYDEKHQEIETQLTKYRKVLDRSGLFLELMEQIHHELISVGKFLVAERFREVLTIESGKEFKIKLSSEGAWLIEWRVEYSGGYAPDQRKIIVNTYKSDWGQIIPWGTVEYLNSGVFLFKQKSFLTALALMSIALEATLRDVLSTKGYTFSHGASKNDIYDFSDAQLDISGNDYLLTFPNAMPKSSVDLPSELDVMGKGLPVDIKIRRSINQRKKCIDLIIRPPDILVDFLSGDRVVQHANLKSIGGLGEALEIARNKEKIIMPKDLPPDMDEILKAVRNNLIHLSNESLETDLTKFKTLSVETVREFVEDEELVIDLISDIPEFINDQYVKLWEDGIKFS
jgi:hypothetical protein